MFNNVVYDEIIAFVKEEPKTIKEIASHINKSWVTAEKYVNEIVSKTNLLGIRHFRKGTKAGLKIVYYKLFETKDVLKKNLQNKILKSQFKHEFDFFDVFQFVKDDLKRVSFNKQPFSFKKIFYEANDKLLIFSGNISFLDSKILKYLEDALKRNVYVKILLRIDFVDIKNFKKVDFLLKKYANFEVKHSRQPLRGIIIDDNKALFRSVFEKKNYKKEELDEDLIVFYYFEDKDWISWLENVFFLLWKTSFNSEFRILQLEKYLK